VAQISEAWCVGPNMRVPGMVVSVLGPCVVVLSMLDIQKSNSTA